ncbi:hypothetical protein MBLNU457_1877t1 [Dothideomycetes sp. NU457]
MANSNICLRCLARPTSVSNPSIAGSALQHGSRTAFSTSATLAAAPPKKAIVVKKGSGASFSKGRVINRGATPAKGRPPAEGERKALRKRIILTNSNALEVQDMQDLSTKNMNDKSMQGQVLGLSTEVVDSMRAVDGFKSSQGWHMFRRPATLITSHTQKLAGQLQSIEQGKSMVRQVLTGEKGSGKSVLNLQAMAMASLKGWIVVHIPEAQDLILGHTSYSPIKTSDGKTMYTQPNYTAELLTKIVKGNYGVLSKLQLKLSHDLPIPIQSNISLARFAELGASDPDIAWPIFTAFFRELTAEGRPPIAYTLDGVAFAMRPTKYLDADVKPIHAHDLTLLNHFLSFLSGSQSLPNGGLVMAVDCQSNRPAVPTLDHALQRPVREAKQAQDSAHLTAFLERDPGRKARYEVTQARLHPQLKEWRAAMNGPSPFLVTDDRVAAVMEDVAVVDVKGLSKEECRGIMEYYARSGMLRQRVDSLLVSEKWTLAGQGVVGEIERGCVMMKV